MQHLAAVKKALLSLFLLSTSVIEIAASQPATDAPLLGRVTVLHNHSLFIDAVWKGALPPPCGLPLVGDVNGDAIADVICPKDAWVSISSADGSHSTERLPIADADVSALLPNLALVSDLNRDGYDDLLAKLGTNPHDYLLVLGGAQLSGSTRLTLSQATALPVQISSADHSCSGFADLVRVTEPAMQTTRQISALVEGTTFRVLDDAMVAPTDPERHTAVRARGVESCAFSVTRRGNRWNAEVMSPEEWTSAGRLPEDGRWDGPYVGDFNGDGRDDALFHGPGLVGWWIAVNGRENWFQRAFEGIPTTLPERAMLRVGDFNGDGADDVLFFPTEPAAPLRLYLAELGEPLAGAQIAVDGVDKTVSSENGSFELMLPKTGAAEVSVRYPMLNGLIDQRRVTLTTRKHQPIRFVLSHAHFDREFRGSSEHEGPRLPGPYVCTGLRTVGERNRATQAMTACPKNHAVFAIDDLSPSSAKPGRPTPHAICCRLPDSTLLTGREEIVRGECPANSIVTGFAPQFEGPAFPLAVLCSYLDTTRARTSPHNPGRYFGKGGSLRENLQSIAPERGPAAFRYALGRLTPRAWDYDGCVGSPWGAPLTGIGGEICSKISFAVIHDAANSLPLPLFPSCSEVESIFDIRSGCR